MSLNNSLQLLKQYFDDYADCCLRSFTETLDNFENDVNKMIANGEYKTHCVKCCYELRGCSDDDQYMYPTNISYDIGAELTTLFTRSCIRIMTRKGFTLILSLGDMNEHNEHDDPDTHNNGEQMSEEEMNTWFDNDPNTPIEFSRRERFCVNLYMNNYNFQEGYIIQHMEFVKSKIRPQKKVIEINNRRK